MTLAKYVADAKDVPETVPKEHKTHQYLRDNNVTLSNQHTKILTADEERVSMAGLNKVKTFFQKSASAKQVESLIQGTRGLEKNAATVQAIPTATKKSLSQFFAENPAIKKELIVAATLLTLIAAVPMIVKSFYPAK
ncbi:unnamed protein product [Hyaloperonospora brassicae]|uniref:RxLR effector candidate protein n=1 Tax=Hyaloperonospora brassicae TaxID=162125 RepID=A0AAV0UYQ6_HYABA|nr:unnamed protein product [Hyaloperonospora brassicae]